MDDAHGKPPAGEPFVQIWTRDGFVGDHTATLLPGYTPDYLSAEGLHVPRRMILEELATADHDDPWALPTRIMASRTGEITLSLSRRRAPTPFTQRNVEADELHFIQRGALRFETDFGVLEAGEADFVCIPRSVAYRITAVSDDLLDLVIESAGALAFDTPAPFGMINFARDVRRAEIAPAKPPTADRHTLLLKAVDGITRFVKPVDPLASLARIAGDSPVWAINLAAIHPVSYGDAGGPPAQFLKAPGGEALLYTLSARPGKMRPPIHHNADYDEIILYVRGPGIYGGFTRPGTLSIVPKGVTHHGPDEEVAGGYQAGMLETRPTMRFDKGVLAATRLMDTSHYGVHHSEG
jgi:homogentisate 1,2-dioxygenase